MFGSVEISSTRLFVPENSSADYGVIRSVDMLAGDRSRDAVVVHGRIRGVPTSSGAGLEDPSIRVEGGRRNLAKISPKIHLGMFRKSQNRHFEFPETLIATFRLSTMGHGLYRGVSCQDFEGELPGRPPTRRS